MIYFNLAWVAYPLWFVTFYCVVQAVMCIHPLMYGIDILPTIALMQIILYAIAALVSGGLGFLFWKAFS